MPRTTIPAHTLADIVRLLNEARRSQARQGVPHEFHQIIDELQRIGLSQSLDEMPDLPILSRELQRYVFVPEGQSVFNSIAFELKRIADVLERQLPIGGEEESRKRVPLSIPALPLKASGHQESRAEVLSRTLLQRKRGRAMESRSFEVERSHLASALQRLIDRAEIPAGFWEAIDFRSRYDDLPEHDSGIRAMMAALTAAFMLYDPDSESPEYLGSSPSAPPKEILLRAAISDLEGSAIDTFARTLKSLGISWGDLIAVAAVLRRALVVYVLHRDYSLTLPH